MNFKAQLVLIVYFVIFFFIGAASGLGQHNTYPVYDIRNCPALDQSGTNVVQRQLNVLPGHGLDNLRNLPMGQVHFYNYSLCKVTEDGKYLIPDSVFVRHLQQGHYHLFAEYIDHWDNYTSLVNSQVNARVDGLFSISGSFSREKQSVKENQVNFNSKTTRVTFRNAVYSVELDPSSELHPSYKSRIYEISAAFQSNFTGETRYLSEKLVRDYGTHFVTSAVAGAIFVQLDSISDIYAHNIDKTTITSSASASFPLLRMLGLGSFSLGYNHNITEQNIQAYRNSLKTSEILTIGGPAFTPDTNLTTYINGIPDKLTTIDRRADPIHFSVTSAQFPELPIHTVRAVARYISEASDKYYWINTRPGCVDPQAQNFDFQANFGDSTYCNTDFSHVDRVFGGIFQTCRQTAGEREDLCHDYELSQVNPQTGDFSCPATYTAVSLFNGTETYTGSYTTYYKTCSIGGWGGCKTKSTVITETAIANYETFWCVVLDTPEQYRGYLFGGFFTSRDVNLVTGLQSCPSYYRIQKIALDVSICVSNNYELGFSYSVGFAGFHSCLVGNPLAIPASSHSSFPDSADWPHACPGGYSQHLLAVQDGCEISACLENGAFESKTLLPPRIPPFQKKPTNTPYSTEKLTVMGSDGGILVRNTAGQWEWYSHETEEAASYYESLQNYNTTRQETSPPDEDISRSRVSIQPSSVAIYTEEAMCTGAVMASSFQYLSMSESPVSTPSHASSPRVDNSNITPSSQGLHRRTTYVSLIMSTLAVASVVILAFAVLASKCYRIKRCGKYEINNRCELQSYRANV